MNGRHSTEGWTSRAPSALLAQAAEWSRAREDPATRDAISVEGDPLSKSLMYEYTLTLIEPNIIPAGSDGSGSPVLASGSGVTGRLNRAQPSALRRGVTNFGRLSRTGKFSGHARLIHGLSESQQHSIFTRTESFG